MRACVVILLVVPLLALASCEEKPTKPDEEIVSNYDIILGANDVPFFVYNTKAKAIVDSIDDIIVTRYRGLALNGDGSHLLISDADWDWGGTMVYDLVTHDTLKKFWMTGHIKVSNRARYIVIYDQFGAFFLNGHTYEIVDTILNHRGIGSFTGDDSKYYYIDDESAINIYDMATRTLDTTFTYVDGYGNAPYLSRIQVDHTGRTCYLLARYSSTNLIIAYSLDHDSTTLYREIGPPYGDLLVTPDGRQVIYSDPGDTFYQEYGSADVIFVDVRTDKVTIVNTNNATAIRSLPMEFWPGWCAVTPDSRYTIVSSAGQGNSIFGMIDNTHHRFVDIQFDTTFPYSIWNFVAVCQKLPH